MDLYYHPIDHCNYMDVIECGRIRLSLGRVPVHPAQPSLFNSGGICCSIIMMSQNRAGERDRLQADADYKTNIEAKDDIEALMKTLHQIDIDKLDKIIGLLTAEKAK